MTFRDKYVRFNIYPVMWQNIDIVRILDDFFR